ncbi:MAG: efflux RND transporter permease subunit [Candidatus Wallbacteria bacterium]|nr:efflux RND transporter permease subunit [Candidatus Wallbacteria bacterium]
MNEQGLITRIVFQFLRKNISVIFIAVSLLAGFFSILSTPREEDPQIVVPFADVFVQYPGASAEEVEKLVGNKLEKLLWQIDGVENVYSVSYRDMAVVTVRFYVGEDRERSLIKLYNRIQSHIDEVTPGITGWVIKPIEIDDVPIINFTLFSKNYSDFELRRAAETVSKELSGVPDTSRVEVYGGRKREIRVELDFEAMAAKSITPLQVYQALHAADSSITAGSFTSSNKSCSVKAGPFFAGVSELRDFVIGVYQQKSVRLSEVAEILDGPEEVSSYTRIGFGQAAYLLHNNLALKGQSYPAVTVAVSKKKGTNAVAVARNVEHKMEELQQKLPSDMKFLVTRNYGETANNKVNELFSGLFFSMIGVVAVIFISMGWREAIIVALSVPITFSLSLFVNFLFGYTINRVTLFALILSLGLVVDDPITNVDNIQRHIAMRKKDPQDATLDAVREVLPPVLIATLAVMFSFLPLFFITGMMGPYMRPMAVNVPLTMFFSLVSSLTFTPWAAYHLLKNYYAGKPAGAGEEKGVNPAVDRLYRRILQPFLESKRSRHALFAATFVLFFLSLLMAFFRVIPLKMLPFDNKSEFQLVLDAPEGTSLEGTDGALRRFEQYLSGISEITAFTTYTGTPSPMDFNGMVRHYYLRQASNLAEIRVNLAPKELRKQQSHEIVLRLRHDLEKLASETGVNLKIAEIPPGPPVLSTIVAEVFGDADVPYSKLVEYSETVRKRFLSEPFLTEVDTYAKAPAEELRFTLDREKSALHGVSAEEVNSTLRLALSGLTPAGIHNGRDENYLPIRCVLPESRRSREELFSDIRVRGTGQPVSMGELGKFERRKADIPIYHKDLKRVVFIIGEMAGRAPVEAIISLYGYFRANPPPSGISLGWRGEGEWKITVDAFRDLGIAFLVALIAIYFLLVLETGSAKLPLVIMLAIPLTMIGVMPGFYILNLLTGNVIGGYQNPVFFTATAMIGMIALGGIVVRNAVVLIEFIEGSLKAGIPLKEALLQSGAVRFRPILLTAGAAILGAWPITLDPIFSGLAWALIFGLFASTLFTLVIVPAVYFTLFKHATNQ